MLLIGRWSSAPSLLPSPVSLYLRAEGAGPIPASMSKRRAAEKTGDGGDAQEVSCRTRGTHPLLY